MPDPPPDPPQLRDRDIGIPLPNATWHPRIGIIAAIIIGIGTILAQGPIAAMVPPLHPIARWILTALVLLAAADVARSAYHFEWPHMASLVVVTLAGGAVGCAVLLDTLLG